jgi:hypothetical protein
MKYMLGLLVYMFSLDLKFFKWKTLYLNKTCMDILVSIFIKYSVNLGSRVCVCVCVCICVSIYYLYVVPWFEFRASCLVGRQFTSWATPSVLLALVNFQIGSWVFVGASLDCPPPTYTSHLARITGMIHHTYVICWDWWGDHYFVLSRLASICNLPDLCLPNSWNSKINFNIREGASGVPWW